MYSRGGSSGGSGGGGSRMGGGMGSMMGGMMGGMSMGGMGGGGMHRFGHMGLDDEKGKLYDHQVVVRMLHYIRPYWHDRNILREISAK